MKKTFKIFMFMVAIVVFVGMVPSSSKAATTAKNYKTSNVTVKDTKKKTVNTYKATKKKIKKVTCSNKNVKIKVAKNKKSFTIVAKKSMNKTVKVCVKFTNKKTKVYKVKFTKKNNGDVTSEDTEDTSEPTNNNTDFSQYVYTNSNGEKVFKYTGSGNSRIIIPEGIQIVESFCPEYGDFNDEITYVRLPSTIETSYDIALFYRKEYNWDTNYYNALYQCRNLQKVEGGNYSFQCNGNTVTRPGDITVWSKDKLVPYDQQKYIDYNNRNKNKKWYK